MVSDGSKGCRVDTANPHLLFEQRANDNIISWCRVLQL